MSYEITNIRSIIPNYDLLLAQINVIDPILAQTIDSKVNDFNTQNIYYNAKVQELYDLEQTLDRVREAHNNYR